MIVHQKLLITALSAILLSTEITVVNGSKEQLCDSKTCLSLCCSPGKAQFEGRCIEDNITSLTSSENRTSVNNSNIETPEVTADEKKFHLFTNDPCAVDWRMSSVSKDFEIFQNGSIYSRDFNGGSIFDLEHHCLFRKPESKVFLAKVCRPWIIKVYWQISCWVFVIIVMLVIFIGYSIVPELKNLHGMVFRAYIATYIGTHLSVLGQQFTADSRTNAHLFTFFVFSLHYFAGSCALWLNVMSFNIWRTFRELRSVESNTKERERRKFILYALYAWVTPAVLHTTILIIMTNVSYFHNLSLNKNLILWTCATLLTTVVVCNAYLFLSTALRISQHKKDTAHLAYGVNKHHETEKQSFNLHVKIFMITGVHTIMWVIWELWPMSSTTILMIIVEVIQGILLFMIFIWKDNVKRSLRRQFDDTLNRLRSTFRTSNSNPTTGSTNVLQP